MSETNIPVDGSLQVSIGWLAALGAAMWGWVLRLVLGRHLKTADRIETKLDDLIERVARLEGYSEGARE